MEIFSKIVSKTKDIKNRLTLIGIREPLSILSLIIIIALDIAVLMTLFAGLSDQSKILTPPHKYINYECRKIINGTEYHKIDNNINKLHSYIFNHNFNYDFYKILGVSKNTDIHPACFKIISGVKKAKSDKNLFRLLQNFIKLEKKILSFCFVNEFRVWEGKNKVLASGIS